MYHRGTGAEVETPARIAITNARPVERVHMGGLDGVRASFRLILASTQTTLERPRPQRAAAKPRPGTFGAS
jgi:hypothetical protein